MEEIQVDHPPFLPELLKVELEGEFLRPMFTQFFIQGGTIEILMEGIRTQILKDFTKKVETLSSLGPKDLEKHYLNVRKGLFEMKKWFEFNVQFHKQIYQIEHLDPSTLEQIQEILLSFDLLLDKTRSYLASIIPLRTMRLETNFSRSCETIRSQLQVNLFKGIQEKKRIPLLHYQVAASVYERVSEKLDQIKAFIIANRAKWDEAILEQARSLYIFPPPEFPFPLIYTPEGLIYIVQEVLEHFIGIGGGKYVSRTFEMQHGSLFALIRPRSKDRYIDDPEIEKFFHLSNYENAWKESSFLKKLQGQEGIIQLKDLFIFSISGKLEFFEIMELLEGQDLGNILHKREHPEKYDFEILPSDEIEISHNLLKGLLALSEQGIIHRDIKSHNVLVQLSSPSQKAKAKIIDFNFACSNADVTEKQHVRYSINYCAPEYAQALLESQFSPGSIIEAATSEKVDVWGVGCLLYRLLLRLPFPWKIEETETESLQQSKTENKDSKAIKEQELKEKEEFRDTFFELFKNIQGDWIDPSARSNPFYPLIKGMLEVDPHKRISAAAALAMFEEILSQIDPKP